MACPDEDTLLALGQGALADGRRDEITAHLDECEICRRTVAALAAEAPVSTETARIGRYELIEPIGAGAMGIVFAARDPELDRNVAVKLLRRDRGGDGGRRLEQRLVGEARALAKLAHPNVIAAYEVGRHEGEVFLAMELVTGANLTRWLAAKPRSRREIVAAFLQAGEGLAAAHDAGIVHRDFKPDNVLVGDDGRVRVTDFGLASGGLGGGSPGSVVGEVALTRTGALAGTPAFMAPEQLEGGAASPKSDQFGFAVALWGALFGVRPFGGETIPALVAATRAGRPRTMPERDVPAGLRTLLLRALAAEPGDRWPDVRTLLGALAPFARPPATRRRLAAAAVIGVVLAGGVALGLAQRRPAAACDATVDAAGMWDRAQRDEVATAFATASAGRAPAVTATVDKELSRYRDAWSDARGEACRLGAAGATRTACLDLQRAQVDALVRLFGAADAAIVESAAAAVGALPDPASCARAGARVDVVRAPAAASHARALQLRLAELKAQRIAGRHARAAAGIDEIVRAAEVAGFRDVRGEALFERGASREWIGELDGAVADYNAAIEIALEDSDDLALARALIGATYGYLKTGGLGEAAMTGRLARGVIARLGGDADLEGFLGVALCMRAWRSGKDLDAGRVECEDARKKLLAAGGPDDYRLWELSVETGNVAYMQGKYEEAIAHYRTAIAESTRLHGPGHPRADAAHGNLAESLVRLGRGAEAIPLYHEVLRRQPDSASFHDGLALALRQTGDLVGALAEHDAARVHAARTGYRSDQCWGEVGVAEVLVLLARFTEVPRALVTAQEICDAHGTPVDRGRVAFVRARLRHHSGDARGARDAVTAALALAAEAGDQAGPGAQLRGEIEAWQTSTAISVQQAP